MDKKQAFKILGIKETNDEAIIKAAYRKLLPTVNPEDDAEGFKRLRESYDTAIYYASLPPEEGDMEQDGEAFDDSPEGLWMRGFRDIYRNLEKRIDIALWKEHFNQEVCFSLEAASKLREMLLGFLMDNSYLPHEVWKLIDERLNIIDDIEELKEVFPEDYLAFVRRNIENGEGIVYDMFRQRDIFSDEVEENVDEYIYKLFTVNGKINEFQYYNLIDVYKDTNALKLLEELSDYGIYHPDEDACILRCLIFELENDICEDKEKTYGMIEECIDRLSEIDETYERAYTYVAEGYYLLGETERAYEIWNSFAGENKEPSIYTQYSIAKYHYDKGDYRIAFKNLEHILERFGDFVKANELMKKINLKLIEEYRSLIEAGKDDEEFKGKNLYYELGWKYFQNDDIDSAIEIVEKAGFDDESEYDYVSLYSRLLFIKQRYEQALPLLLRWHELLFDPKVDEDGDEKKLRRRSLCCAFLAEIYKSKEDYENAILYMKSAVQHENIIAEKYNFMTQLAEIHLKNGDAEESASVSGELLKQNPDYFPAYVSRMEASVSLGDWQQVIDDFFVATRIYSEYYKPYVLAAYTFYYCREYENAQRVLAQARECCAEYVDDLKLVDAMCLRFTDKSEEGKRKVLALLDEILDDLNNERGTIRNEFELYSTKAIIHLDLKEYDETIETALEGEKKFPELSVFPFVLGDVYSDDAYIEMHGEENYELALSYYKKAEEKGNPDNLWLLYSIGFCYKKLDNRDKSLEYLERVLAIDFYYGDVAGRVIDEYVEMYGTGYQSGYLEKALLYAKKLVDYKADSNNLIRYANVLMSGGRCDEAIEAFGQALEQEDDNVYLLRRLGNAYRRKKDPDKAIEYYKKALKVNKEVNKRFVYRDLGYAYEAKGEYEKAILVYEDALREYVDEPLFYKALGYCYIRLERYDEARAAYERAYEDELNINLANVYYEENDIKTAIALIDDGLHGAKKEFFSDNYLLMGDFYLESLLMYERAIDYYKKAIECSNNEERKLSYYVDMVKAYLLMGEREEAKECAIAGKDIIEKVKNSSLNTYIKGGEYTQIDSYMVSIIYMGLGEYDKSEKILKKMDEGHICINCQYSLCYEAVLYLAILYMLQGRLDEAYERIIEASKRNGKEPFVRNIRKMIEERRK